MRNLRLDICYDGTKYRGWQRLSKDDNTIQGKLEQTLSRVLGEDIESSGSGRTDAGTHALGQVANFHCNSQMSCEEILAGLHSYLPKDIGIYSCRDVSARFHARLNAKEKTYRYRLWNGANPCVFDRKYVYIYRQKLDICRMQEASKVYLGTHDFSAFCGNKNMSKSTVRTIKNFEIHQDGDEIVFTVTGNGLLQHMVRIMVGTLLEIGEGKRNADGIQSLFGGVRADAGPAVPSCGLCLMEVTY